MSTLLVSPEKWNAGFTENVGEHVVTRLGRRYLNFTFVQRWVRTTHPTIHWVVDRDPNTGVMWFERDKRGGYVSVCLQDAESGATTPSLMHPIAYDGVAKHDFDTADVDLAIQDAVTKLVALHLGLGLDLQVGASAGGVTATVPGVPQAPKNGMSELARLRADKFHDSQEQLYRAIAAACPVIGVPKPPQASDGGPDFSNTDTYDNATILQIAGAIR